jgi:hypothetical protein
MIFISYVRNRAMAGAESFRLLQKMLHFTPPALTPVNQ